MGTRTRLTLPHAADAERSVLAGVMLRNETLHDAAALVTADDFYLSKHRVVWSAMLRLAKRGEGIDPVTLEAEIGQGELNLVGGLEGLGKIADHYVSSRHVETYARLVRDRARRRRLVMACREVAEAGLADVEDESTFIDTSERKLLSAAERRGAGGFVTAAKVMGPTIEAICERMKRKDPIIGIPTGITALDHMIGGLQGGKLYVIAGRPGHGKSALAGNLVTNAALLRRRDRVYPSIVFSLEMGGEELFERKLISVCRTIKHTIGLPERVRHGRITNGDWQVLTQAAELLHTTPICVEDDASVTAADICAQARRWRRGTMCGPDGLGLVVVDYLQLMAPAAQRKNGTRERDIAEISRALKLLAKDLRVPVVLLSQLNRNVDNRSDHRPVLADLRESGAIEQDADVILFVYRPCQYIQDHESPEYKACEHDAEIIVGKQRGGKTGIVNCDYFGPYFRFENLAMN